jgi:RND superfamily putative drug exporter
MGRALEHATLPYLFTTQGSGSGQQLPFNEQQNANTDKQAQINADTVKVLRKEIEFFQSTSDELHKTVVTVEDLEKVTDEMNSEISNFDDFWRPIKAYFYWKITVSTFPFAGHSDRYSMRSTTSTSWPMISGTPEPPSRP